MEKNLILEIEGNKDKYIEALQKLISELACYIPAIESGIGTDGCVVGYIFDDDTNIITGAYAYTASNDETMPAFSVNYTFDNGYDNDEYHHGASLRFPHDYHDKIS